MFDDELRRPSMRGRGPRGHQRADGRIFEEICDRLTDAREVDASDLEVAVVAGEVSLKGSVLDRGMRRRAEEIAEAVSGVRHVRNDVRVRPQGTAEVSAGYGTPVASAYGLEAQGDAVPERPAPAASAPADAASRTVAGLFDSPDDAERALLQLEAAGYDRTTVSITRDEGVPSGGGEVAGFRRGGALVTAVVPESRADEVIGLLQQSGAADLDARHGEWRATGWREYEPLS